MCIRDRIRSSIENADNVNKLADEKLQNYEAKIANVEMESRQMLKAARDEAKVQAKEIVDSANEKARNLIDHSQKEIRREQYNACLLYTSPLENEIVVNKTTDSVTTGTNYLTLLQFMGIETVVVTGIVTDQCVASTVRGLADAGLKVICVEDACAAGSQELHDAELKIMSVIYCDVLSTDETIALIRKNL